MATVAFLGTGLLGSAMVEGMLRRGDAVTVWNRTEAKARALEALGAHGRGHAGRRGGRRRRVHMTLPDDAVVDRDPGGRDAAAAAGRDRHRSLDDVAARHRRRACRGCNGAGVQVSPRAGVHVAADGAATPSA